MAVVGPSYKILAFRPSFLLGTSAIPRLQGVCFELGVHFFEELCSVSLLGNVRTEGFVFTTHAGSASLMRKFFTGFRYKQGGFI